MKFNKLLTCLGLTAVLGAGVGIAITSKQAESKKAEAVLGNTSGHIGVELQYNGDKCWREANAKVAVELKKDSTSLGWTNMITTSTDKQNYVLYYSGLSQTPNKMRFVRFDSAATSTSGTIWNEYTFNAFADCAWIKGRGDGTSAGTYDLATTVIRSNKTNWQSQDDHKLLNFKVGGDNHFEIYGEVAMKAGEVFGIDFNNNEKWCQSYSNDTTISTAFSGNGSENITCNTAGTYAFYYDYADNNVYITTPALAASGWANAFLGANCTATKNGWNSSAVDYEFLTVGAKSLFLAEEHVDHLVDESSAGKVTQAVQRYDYVLERFGTDSYPDFIGRVDAGKVTPKASSNYGIQNITDSSNSTTLIIVLVSTSVLAAIGGYFIVHRKKEN